jgi:hypothetical protein
MIGFSEWGTTTPTQLSRHFADVKDDNVVGIRNGTQDSSGFSVNVIDKLDFIPPSKNLIRTSVGDFTVGIPFQNHFI